MKFETKTIRTVEYRDLDEAITEFLKSQGINKNYQCVAYEEWSNRESHEFDVEPEIDEDIREDLLNGKFHYKTSDILNWMCALNQIEAGEYLVEVSW